MYVSHFNSFLRGGASTAAQQLHRSLIKLGLNSRFQYRHGEMFSQSERSDRDGVLQYSDTYFPTHWQRGTLVEQAANSIRYRIHREAFKWSTRGLKPGSEIFSSPHGAPATPWPPIGHPAAGSADANDQVIHLHWISKLIDYPSFFGSLSPDQPVVWTLHDMNVMTGGCHFSGGCQRFESGCGSCPQLAAARRDMTAALLQVKRQSLRRVNLHVVAPSRWLLDQAKSSLVFENARSFSRIPYGMPIDRLYPVDRVAARQSLGIDANRVTLCFGAMNLNSRRKGTRDLLDSLEQLAGEVDVQCLVFGSGQIDVDARSLLPMIQLGKVVDDVTRRTVYSAADFFILPSNEDNLPLTGLESMACGTPVVAFDAGGVSDYVIPGQTGLLAEKHNVAELTEMIRYAIQHTSQMRAMGVAAHRKIMGEFESSLEAERYHSLYQSITQADTRTERNAA